MAILALDLGTKTGWAIKTGPDILSGTQPFTPQRFDGGGMRYLRFSRWLTELEGNRAIERVYYEEVRRHMSTDAAHCYGGFLATLQAWCETRNIPYAGIPVGTIKKHATGSGAATKDAMIAAAVAKGWSPADDNEADALHILDYALKEMP